MQFLPKQLTIQTKCATIHATKINLAVLLVNISRWENHFQSTQTRRKFRIREDFNCKSTHVIYLVTCLNCKRQYVGDTGQNLSIRFNKHRKGKRITGFSKHFRNGNCDSSSHNNYKIQIIDQITNKKRWRHKEYFWMSELQTFHSNGGGGMNRYHRPPYCWY